MASQTTNYNLVKPAQEDYYDIKNQNDNMDIIDTGMKNLDNGKEAVLKSATEKTTLENADALPLVDSADSSKTKKLSFANLKSLLKTIFATTEDVSTLNSSLSAEVTNRTNALSSEVTARANADALKLDKSGGTMTGILTAQNNTSYTSKQVRNITLSTADPSGGGNGDLWFKYS